MSDICDDSEAFINLRATLCYEDRIALGQSVRLGWLANKEAGNKPYWVERVAAAVYEERQKYIRRQHENEEELSKRPIKVVIIDKPKG